MRKIGTHNGQFHADEALAVAVLRRVLGEVEVVRTRDTAVLAACDLRVDVGGKSDEVGEFDHHQRGGAGARANGIPYASAGLIWRVFGPVAVANLALDLKGRELEVALKVDERFVQYVDASDNGVALTVPKTEGITGFSISAAVASLNPTWQESQEDGVMDALFLKAVDFIDAVLGRVIAAVIGTVQAENVVLAAVASAVDPRVVVLDAFVPWAEVVVPNAPEALYMVYPSRTNEWLVQCVPDVLGSFGKRKALPKAWGGLRGADLATLTGVADAVFAHPGLFICGAATREGAMKLASLAVLS